MTAEAQQIIGILSDYLMKNPGIRFAQALHSLDINRFHYTDEDSPRLRDPYNDLDTVVLARVEKAIADVPVE